MEENEKLKQKLILIVLMNKIIIQRISLEIKN